MVTSALALVIAASSMGATIPGQIVERQNSVFQEFWGTDFVWKFDDLPEKSSIPEFRVPYSGYIYLDTNGGTINAMRKYDQAFHRGRMSATAFEQWDTTAFKKPQTTRGGLFGFRSRTVMATPNWHGHCNGWTAAAIRHAEPQTSVRRNGVVFTPRDIKAMLAEIYIYNETRDLIKSNEAVNAGVFHAIITNWVGRGMHPLGLEADPGEEKWNYPIYGYSTSSAKRSDREVDVRMNLVYANSSRGESDQSPRISRTKSFSYRLNLNSAGEIIGGYFYRGSSQIDMLWIPVRPKQGKQPGNERGNPHVDVDEVLAIWRESVPAEVRNKWPVIDPPAENRIADTSQIVGLVPLQQQPAAEVDQLATADDATPTAEAEDASEEEAVTEGEAEATEASAASAAEGDAAGETAESQAAAAAN
jgi:hypothetical protein